MLSHSGPFWQKTFTITIRLSIHRKQSRNNEYFPVGNVQQRTFTTQMPMNRKHKRQNTQGAEAGFTLIELIIVIVLASILGTFVFSIISKSLASQINMQEEESAE